MAPWIALCSSSDEESFLVIAIVGPAPNSAPEWHGDDRIDAGQLITTPCPFPTFIKFPENVSENNPFDIIPASSPESLAEDDDSRSNTLCLRAIFSYNGFTFFIYFFITSRADDDDDALVGPEAVPHLLIIGTTAADLGSFLKTDEIFPKENDLLFLADFWTELDWDWLSLWPAIGSEIIIKSFSSSKSATKLGRGGDSQVAASEEEELPVERRELAEEEAEEDELAKNNDLTMERRGVGWSGSIFPL